MAYPPQLPPTSRTDSTISAVNHAQDHNKISAALRDLVLELGASPAGGYANLTDRLLGIASGQDAAALLEFRNLLDLVQDVSGIATPDTVVNALLRLDGSATKQTLEELVGITVAPEATPAASRGAIQAALTTGATLGVPVRLRGDFTVNGQIDVPTGATITGDGATITQTATRTPLFRLLDVDNVTITGITAHGLTSDYVNTSAVYGAAGVYASGGCTNVRIADSSFLGFAGAGVYSLDTDLLVIDNVTITGAGAAYITSTAQNYGCCISFGGSGRITITNSDLSESCQGVVTGEGITDVIIANNRVHHIRGQHGLYLETCNKLVVADNIIHSIGLAGIKLQIATEYAHDSSDVTVTGNVIRDVGAQGILLTNTTAGKTRRNCRQVIANNVITTPLNEGILAGTIDDVLIANNVITDAAASGIRLIDAARVKVANNMVNGSGDSGVRLETVDEVEVADNTIRDAGRKANTSTQFGISAPGSIPSTNVTIRNNTIKATHSTMRYGMTLGNPATMRVIGNYSEGHAEAGFRLDPAGAVAEYRDNTVVAGLDLVASPTDGQGTPWRERFGTAAPTSGAWRRGDRVWNATPSSGGALGWVCVANGSPGTWRVMASIAAT